MQNSCQKSRDKLKLLVCVRKNKRQRLQLWLGLVTHLPPCGWPWKQKAGLPNGRQVDLVH